MIKRFITLKVAKLKNSCPVCFSKKDLRLTFKQTYIETGFYKSITEELKHSLSCAKCKSQIYPEQWTEDIESVIEYQCKTVTPKKSLKRYKKKTYLIIGIAIILTIAIALNYDKL